MADRYYLVEQGSVTHEKIAAAFRKRASARRARWDFMEREFPAAKGKKSGWVINYSESGFASRLWAIVPPSDYVMPADWKYDKRSHDWVPRVSTKRGRELHREMQSEPYLMPGAGSIGNDIGCPTVWCGLTLCSIGIKVTPQKRFIVVLQTEHKKPPQFSARISDLEVEKMMASKPRKKATRKTTAKA